MKSDLYRTLRKHIDKIVSKEQLFDFVQPFTNKETLEVGGPSAIFRKKGLLPIYSLAKSVDNVNFSFSTIWENKIEAGDSFKYDNKTGKQFVLEASDLNTIRDNSYSGIISCHCLEHTANPLKVLFEWKRILQDEGYLLLVLPDKHRTFDNRRPYTTFDHLLRDFQDNVGEDDLTHLEEILALHNKKRDNGLTKNVDFRARSLDNFKNRCLHHHVFEDKSIEQMSDYLGFSLIHNAKYYPYHLVYLLKKNRL